MGSLVSWFLAPLSRSPWRAARAPWWRGRELLASVLHFGLAMASFLLVGLALLRQWR